jgi:hypothetical protein
VPLFLLSTHILHNIPFWIPRLCLSSSTLPFSEKHKFDFPLCMCPCQDYELTPSAAYTSSSIHHVLHTPSSAYSDCSICQVEHTQSTQYTNDSTTSLHSHENKLTTQCCLKLWDASLHNGLLSAYTPQGLKANITWPHSHGGELTHCSIESHNLEQGLSATCKYSSNVGQLGRSCASPYSPNQSLQWYCLTHSNTANKSATNVPQLKPLSSPKYTPQVYL